MNQFVTPLTQENFQYPQLMGILNVTDDSFSDGGRFLKLDQALEQANKLVEEGADIIDIGGESTRPGARAVSLEQETKRVIPVLTEVRKNWPKLVISVDTRKFEVARATIDLGADIINDISALTHDPRLAGLVAANPQVRAVLMHMRGQPETMQADPCYEDVVAEINAFFEERIAFALSRWIDRSKLILDPGIGFGKTAEHNFRLLAHLDEFKKHGLPLLLGVSRKRFIASAHPSEPPNRTGGTLAAAALAASQGVEILRVHDVGVHRQFFAVWRAISQEAG